MFGMLMSEKIGPTAPFAAARAAGFFEWQMNRP
jgi:hypothetical protein